MADIKCNDPTTKWRKRCQRCGDVKETTRLRNVRTKEYEGTCGDSFCYSSCDSPSCKPIDVAVCSECVDDIKK